MGVGYGAANGVSDADEKRAGDRRLSCRSDGERDEQRAKDASERHGADRSPENANEDRVSV